MNISLQNSIAPGKAHDGERYFNTSAIGIIESDANYRVLRANPCICAMLGYAEEELLGREWMGLCLPSDLPRARLHFEPYFLRGEVGPALDQFYVAKSGAPLEVSVSVEPGPFGPDGKPAYYVGFVRDISQRRQAENEVQTLNRRIDDLRGTLDVEAGDVTARIEAQRENVESRRIFEDLFDNSDAAIIDYDFSILFGIVQGLRAEGVRNLRGYIAESDERLQNLVDAMRINNANAPALRMLGVASLQELGKLGELGKQSMNIVDIAEAMFLGETRLRRSEYLVAGGTPIPVVYSMRIPLTEEDARRVPIVIMDLSDIRLAEAARQATVAKSKFLSSMSHEIRTPLNGMIGNLELLALTSLDNDQFELVDDADKAAKALLGLVGNILDFSKIEAGKLTTEVGDINPALLVEEAVDVLQSRGRQKKIFVTATFGADVPTLVLGDAMRVRQILLNLIGNAVKFTDHGGVKVSLTTGKWDRDTCELKFSVYDSGRGFDPIQEAHLFEPFTQDRSAIDGVEGTGLGLSICKSLVEALGGAIGCKGTPGEGATFWFTLPVTVVRPAPPVSRPDLTGMTTMVIGGEKNHSASIVKSLEDYFTARGCAVVTETPEGALAFALDTGNAKAPDIKVAVLVTDGMDLKTLDVARKLRERHIVIFLYDIAPKPITQRAALSHGFASIIPVAASADHLDRNIRILVGHALARDRLAAQQAAVVSAFAPALRGTRVLVLEDRLVNQIVIQKQLKKLGIECTLAANGIKGLEMLDRQSFDLILCDCSMPEMNGYDFTRALRLREAATPNQRRVSVVALTANAFREDADKCFEAGMDDFISKPVTMDRLSAMLVRWLKPLSVPPVTPDAAPCVNAPPAIDLTVLVEIMGSSEPDTITQVLAAFLATAAGSLARVEKALLSGDLSVIRSAAHGAKGEARTAAATVLADFYAELETKAKAGDLAAARTLPAGTAAELERIEGFIRTHLAAQVS